MLKKTVPFMQLLSVYHSGLSGPLGGIWSHRGSAHACIPGANCTFVSNLNAPSKPARCPVCAAVDHYSHFSETPRMQFGVKKSTRKSSPSFYRCTSILVPLVLEGNGGLHNFSPCHPADKNDDSSMEIVQTCKVLVQGHFLHWWVHKTLQ